jgi:hypothetical protein
MLSDPKRNRLVVEAAPSERRKHARYSFSATAEAVDAQSGARIVGRVSDLGQGGCYVDAMSPFPVDTSIKLTVTRENKGFWSQAKVVYSASGLGMGLMFTHIDAAQLGTLDKWLRESSGESAPETEIPAELNLSNSRRGSQDRNYVLYELILILMRKRTLSEAEGKDLLHKLL